MPTNFHTPGPQAARRRRRHAPRRLDHPTREALADAYRRLHERDWPIRQATDHGTHEAIYISDPDGNDLELAWDRPYDEWPRTQEGYGALVMDQEVDLEALVAEAT